MEKPSYTKLEFSEQPRSQTRPPSPNNKHIDGDLASELSEETKPKAAYTNLSD